MIYKTTLQLWEEIGINNFWGDRLDVRFYLINFLKEKKIDTLLDISSNYGIILNGASSRLGIGLDYSMEWLSKSKKYFPVLKNIQASSEFLPFRDKSVDAVVLAHSLPGWDYRMDSYLNKNQEIASKKLFEDIHRILKPGGKLYITTVNGNHIYYRDKKKLTLDKVLSYVNGLYYIQEIVGWNPLPVLANLIPYTLLRNAPPYIKRLMFFPSVKMYSFIPGIWWMILALSRFKGLNKHCRHLFFICQKI
jgi:SAM-dependent methyltransferase